MAKVSFTKLGLKMDQEIKTIKFNEQEIEINRWPLLKENYTNKRSMVQHLSIKEQETIKCRYKRDFDYYIQLTGGFQGTMRDRAGNVMKTPTLVFEPLIPESYWKKK